MEEHRQVDPLPSRIASLVHAHFNALPSRSKPIVHPDGSREWIPMTGIVVVKGENTPSETLTCVAVTTGAKCLYASQVPRCRGLVLHDCHAEILAIRAFNYWLLNECRSINSILAREEEDSELSSEDNINSKGTENSPFVRRRNTSAWPPFELQPDIKIYMYCTCAPCGDASMELCMAAQEDPTPWEITTPNLHPNPASSSNSNSSGKTDIPEQADSSGKFNVTPNLLDGRAHFSLLGIVRRKPARVDAESTRSKSCSDKLALRQVSSLLSYGTSLLVASTGNAYLEGLILPEEEISRVGCERSFGETGRMRALKGKSWLPGEVKGGVIAEGKEEEDVIGYRFRPFKILSVPTHQIEKLWPFGKPTKNTTLPPVSPETGSHVPQQNPEPSPPPKHPVNDNTKKKSKPGNVSAIWIAAPPSSSLPSSHPCSTPSADNGSKSLPVLLKSKTGLYENIVNGVKQGYRASTPMARGASSLSRAKMWGLLRDMVQSPENEMHTTIAEGEHRGFCRQIVEASTYGEFKRGSGVSMDSIRAREKALKDTRDVLKGWIPNTGDESWGLDVLNDPTKSQKKRMLVE